MKCVLWLISVKLLVKYPNYAEGRKDLYITATRENVEEGNATSIDVFYIDFFLFKRL